MKIFLTIIGIAAGFGMIWGIIAYGLILYFVISGFCDIL